MCVDVYMSDLLFFNYINFTEQYIARVLFDSAK